MTYVLLFAVKSNIMYQAGLIGLMQLLVLWKISLYHCISIVDSIYHVDIYGLDPIEYSFSSKPIQGFLNRNRRWHHKAGSRPETSTSLFTSFFILIDNEWVAVIKRKEEEKQKHILARVYIILGTCLATVKRRSYPLERERAPFTCEPPTLIIVYMSTDSLSSPIFLKPACMFRVEISTWLNRASNTHLTYIKHAVSSIPNM